MTDIILIAIVALIVGLAIGYIAKEKKKRTCFRDSCFAEIVKNLWYAE